MCPVSKAQLWGRPFDLPALNRALLRMRGPLRSGRIRKRGISRCSSVGRVPSQSRAEAAGSSPAICAKRGTPQPLAMGIAPAIKCGLLRTMPGSWRTGHAGIKCRRRGSPSLRDLRRRVMSAALNDRGAGGQPQVQNEINYCYRRIRYGDHYDLCGRRCKTYTSAPF